MEGVEKLSLKEFADSSFSDRLKAERKRKGIKSQAELSKLSGVPLDSLKKYESPKRRMIPEKDNLLLLAKTLKVSPLYLLGETPFRSTWEEYDSLHEEDLKRIRKGLQFTESAEALGFYHQGTDDPEKDYEEYMNYNRMYQERKEAMKTRSEIKVIIGSEENRIIENFETGEITIQAVSKEDVEKGFQQLIRRGIIEG